MIEVSGKGAVTWMAEVDLLQKLLDFGGTGVLAVGLYMLLRGQVIPYVTHERFVNQLLEIIKEKNAEILRLQQRNEENVAMLQTGTLITSKSLEILKLAKDGKAE
jgi:hypothetical protein